MNRLFSCAFALATLSSGLADELTDSEIFKQQRSSQKTNASNTADSQDIERCNPRSPKPAQGKKSRLTNRADANKTQFAPGDVLPENVYLAGYNAPAATCLKGDTLSIYLDTSYLYWLAIEEGLNLANSISATIYDFGSTPFYSFQEKPSVIFQPSEYSSGFKAGVGVSANNWTIAGEYTWIRQHTYKTANAPFDPSGATGLLKVEGWYVQPVAIDAMAGLYATSLSSSWRLRLDLIDLSLSRPFYESPRVILSPFFGLRAAIISQFLRLNAQTFLFVINSGPLQSLPSPTVSHNHTRSWAIGPRTGFGASYLLRYGLRLEGDAAASLLFTHYRKITHREEALTTASPSIIVVPPKWQLPHVNMLRPALELGLGVGWGAYFSSQQYHIDLLASYDFKIFWNQNTMRQLVDQLTASIDSAPGDLYLHGLTGKLRFDF
jgi:hypothetical protein